VVVIAGSLGVPACGERIDEFQAVSAVVGRWELRSCVGRV